MSSLSSVQRWGQLGELSDIKGVGWHSGRADKIGKCLDHGNTPNG
jgi:hypothetical protein